jgi:hypothetical protein
VTASSTPSCQIDEDARRRFEAAWCTGWPESIEQFLPAEDDVRYLATLEELVAIDLEFRWKAAREGSSGPANGSAELPTRFTPRLRDYLLRFPRLARPDIVQRLEAEEAQVRQRYGGEDTPTRNATRIPLVTPDDRAELSRTRDLPRQSGRSTEPGPTIPGYEIVGELGRGGMGVVYQALQTSLKRIVALKMIRSADHAGPEERARFRSEAEAVAHLQHANIVQVHEIGEHDGCPFFSLEFIDGGSGPRRPPA